MQGGGIPRISAVSPGLVGAPIAKRLQNRCRTAIIDSFICKNGSLHAPGRRPPCSFSRRPFRLCGGKEKEMAMKKYVYLIVGSGLYGAVFAQQAKAHGKSCLILEKREHTGGNLYCEDVGGVHVHKYGAHIFHTSSRKIWDYVNGFAEFNRFTNSPIANYKGEIYNLPFNMNTFSRMWGIVTPEEARQKIAEQQAAVAGEPRNLEEQAIRLVGYDIYSKLIKGYTEKQWGRDCSQLPAFIIKRLPVRYTYDNNYFNDRYQGIPIGGYNVLIDALLEGCDVELQTDYLARREAFDALADRTVYTGMLDAFYGYSHRLRENHFSTIREKKIHVFPKPKPPYPQSRRSPPGKIPAVLSLCSSASHPSCGIFPPPRKRQTEESADTPGNPAPRPPKRPGRISPHAPWTGGPPSPASTGRLI